MITLATRFALYLSGIPLILLFYAGVVFVTMFFARLTLPPQHLPDYRRWMAGAMLFFTSLDWSLVVLLPRLNLAYGFTWISASIFTAIRTLFAYLSLWLYGLVGLLFAGAHSWSGMVTFLVVWAVMNLVLLALEYYSMYVEPFKLEVSELRVAGPCFLPDRPLRIVHVTDTHIEATTKRERQLLEKIAALEPDLIVLTGDYLNIDFPHDERSIQAGREFLGQLKAPYGVFAVPGTIYSDTLMTVPRLFQDQPITLLRDEFLQLSLPGGLLCLLGVANLDESRSDGAVMTRMARCVDPQGYKLLLYHTPELFDEAAVAGIDLYLAGHTHGGQVPAWIWNGLLKRLGKSDAYKAGPHYQKSTLLYVNRGIGMEGINLPRVRIGCPPEILLIHLGGPAASV